MTHGSPESIEEHLSKATPVERFIDLAKVASADVIITGHSHEQFAKEVGGVFFLNPGSVGRPGDGNPQAAYAVVRFDPFRVELVRVDYDIIAAAETLRRKGLPESFSQMLLRGIALDKIAEEDKARKRIVAQKCSEATRNCEVISKGYWPDTEHFEQVRKISLDLFDGLKGVHNYGDRERCWLECASILHDIGLSQQSKNHNKRSMELILNDSGLLLPSEDRRIVASIARYHRKGFPEKKHYNLLSLTAKNIQKIIWLSGVLRLADSLDYSHNRIVIDLALTIRPNKITITCTTGSDPLLEQQAFLRKKDLLEKVLKRKIALVWKHL
jgi:hypothetical protein